MDTSAPTQPQQPTDAAAALFLSRPRHERRAIARDLCRARKMDLASTWPKCVRRQPARYASYTHEDGTTTTVCVNTHLMDGLPKQRAQALRGSRLLTA